ncbi:MULTISPECIES: winged helix-turn-helix transcriptional regulator [unclassified Micromonospora]|uniref:winged helix-turn-helix transcriptional regulator n=1 Tax=unclassified Micromonospora TaxID=2617518 RepID=UPI003CF156CE
MLGQDYAHQTCSLARSLEVVGERWTMLVLRDVLVGRRRFDELVASLGVTRTVLTQRLRLLVAEGVLERRAYQQRPERFEYHLTAKGRELTPVVAQLMWWGDRHYPEPAGPPRLLVHDGCGGPVRAAYRCGACHAELHPDQVATRPGPGAPAADADRPD